MQESNSISLDLASLRTLYADGWTPAKVMALVRRRIEAYDDPAVWIDLLPSDAVAAQIDRLLDRRAAGASLPLCGVPFGVKDNIDVAGRPTTAACPEFAYVPERSATVVRKLCDAGAIVVGKTNLDQFATGLVGTRSPYGACRNVFDRDYVSGGSSSGSGVAVAAGLVSFALGTDTAGSGRVPAGFGNIVGYKPTRGRLSAAGVVPACKSLDCVSIFSLTCRDADEIAAVAAGYDASDPFSRELVDPPSTQTRFSGTFHFGVPHDEQLQFFGDRDGPAMFRQAVERLKSLGGEPVQIDYAPFAAAAKLLYEGPWLAERVAGVGNFLERSPNAGLPLTRGIIEGGRRFSAVDAFKGQYELRRLMQLTRAEWAKMDVLLVPTAGRSYRIDEIEREPIKYNTDLGYYTNFVNLMDLCAVAVPNGFQPDGLPAGVTLIGPAGCDCELLGLAGRFHQSLGGRLGATAAFLLEIPMTSTADASSSLRLAVVGAHLSGQPLNHQLTALGGRLVRTCRTSPNYRLYALPGATPPKPGLVRVPNGESGGAIEVEVWELSPAAFGAFVASIPPPLGVGSVQMEDGSIEKCFLCEQYAVAGAADITHHGGWRNYMKSRSA